MIHLAVKEYCQSCPYFEAETEKAARYADNIPYECDAYIECEHRDICERLEKIFTGEISPPL